MGDKSPKSKQRSQLQKNAATPDPLLDAFCVLEGSKARASPAGRA
jgi:hypothetical protein